MTSATEKLRRMLDERGVKTYHEQNYITWRDANDYQCFAFETYERPGLLRVHCNLTPEQAIAATLGGANATNNQESIVRSFLRKISPNRDWDYLGEHEHAMIADLVDAIAATLGSGTCSIEERNGDWYCDACGEMVGTCDPASELWIDGNAVELWNYCPNCGAKVVE